MSTEPKSIWLQRDEDDCRSPCETEGVTWCEDKINDTDTEYVRADLLTAEREVSDKLATALQRIAKLRIVEVDEIIDDYVDLITKVVAIRATHTNREQAD